MRHLLRTRSWNGYAPLGPIIPSTTVIIRIGVFASASGRAVLEWTTLSRSEGPGTLAQSIAAVAIGGHIALIGVLTGRAGEIPTAYLMAKQARLQGLIVGSRKHQMDFIRALDVTGIKPAVDRSFGLDEIADAFRYEAGGHHFGKICLEF